MSNILSLRRLLMITTGSLIAVGMAVNLSGCTPGNNVGGATAAGAASGALLGAAAFHGDGAWLGVLGGALVGGIVGNQVGQYMDRQDQINMRSALNHTPQGDQATWTNHKSNVTYTVTPVRTFHRQGRYCREYQTKIIVGGKPRSAYGKACRMPDGQWKIIK